MTHRTDTCLTARSELAGNDAGDSEVEVRVIEYNEARVGVSVADASRGRSLSYSRSVTTQLKG
jgi:hypothetical protein